MNAKEELQICLHEIKYQNIVNAELKRLFLEMLSLQDKNLISTYRYKKLNELIEKNEKLIEESEIKVIFQLHKEAIILYTQKYCSNENNAKLDNDKTL